MKKLLIAAAAIAVAGMTQAVSITWGSGNLTTADGTAFVSANKEFTASAFYLSASAAANYATISGASITDVKSADIYKDYKAGTLGTATLTGSNYDNLFGGYENSVTLYDNSSSAGTYYAAIIYTYDDATQGEMYIANIAAANYGGSAQVPVGNLGTVFGGSTNATQSAISGWTAAPEPTSGLLMVLGAAMVALRRKRA